MLNTFSILLPVFGLIAAGFFSRKTRIMGQAAASELNRFVVWLALPALLFDIMANSHWSTLFKPNFISVFLISTGLIFVITLLWRTKQGQALADASIESVAASYSNTGYVGFPLLLLAFGESSQVPTTIATIIVVCVLFAIAITLIETGLKADVPLGRRIKHVLLAVFRNPLVLAPIAGVVFAMTPFNLPEGVETFLKLLANAASPCALVSLGLFLADANKSSSPHDNGLQTVAWALTAAKLIAQPLIVAGLAIYVFDMDWELTMMAVMLAALPTGTGPFMLAELYQRNAVITAQTVLFSTICSLFSLTLILQFI